VDISRFNILIMRNSQKEGKATMTGWTLTCKLCGDKPAAVPIRDKETDAEMWICDECNEELFDAQAFQQRIVAAINTQISHHEHEGNTPAVRSLQHIKKLILIN
jgi:ribosome-binding protein aMBF1 (putative translation factor)